MDYKKIVQNFLVLQDRYQFTRRNLMTKERFKDFANASPDLATDLLDTRFNEPLIEHVGHLPIVATYFHQFLEYRDQVDLGHALTMLAIHDIGETVVGDVFAYTKTAQEEEEEFAAALTLLPDYLKDTFREFEETTSFAAKYAKSIDALAGFLPVLDMPKVILKRFHAKGASVDDIVNKKRGLMTWDKTMVSVFDVAMEQAYAAERGEVLPLGGVDYDLP